MLSLQYIQALNDDATRKAEKGGTLPYQALKNGDDGVFKCPNLGVFVPIGFKVINEYFVDSSGFGSGGEPALTIDHFLTKVEKDSYYAIKEAGQFQVYIREFKKLY